MTVALILTFLGPATVEVASNAGRLLERSLLGELRAVAARALSGLDMFSGDFAELVAGDAAFAPGTSPPDVRFIKELCASVWNHSAASCSACCRHPLLVSAPLATDLPQV